MLALEVSEPDAEIYNELNAFNKLVLQYNYPIFTAPSKTAAKPFHERVLSWYEDILKEMRVSKGWGMPMAELDAVQHAMLSGSPKWRVAWVKAFGHTVDNPFKTLSECVAKHPEVLNVMWSRLEPGAELPWHKGPFRGVIRYHLAFQVPKGDLGLEVRTREEVVGAQPGQVYQWKEGAGITFDDTHWHRAWNHTTKDRVVLFVDVLRPLGALNARRDALIKRLTNSEICAKLVGSIAQKQGNKT